MTAPESDTTRYERGSLVLDRLKRKVTIQDVPVALTMREFTLLEFFLQHPGEVLTRHRIADAIWESAARLETNLIDVYVLRLRRKLGSDPPSGANIHTIRGVGYMLD